MNDFIDLYCERTALGIWGEPINFVTNLAFFIAAFFAYRLAKKRDVLSIGTGLLIVLLVAIGTGSSLFHMFATRTTMLMDVLPILLFQILFLVLYSAQVMRLHYWLVGVLLLMFLAAIYGTEQLPAEWLNGSLGYIPALAALLGFGIYHAAAGKPARWALLVAFFTFCVSLTFRSLDMEICPALPFGIHFMWHILNGLVLYLSMHGLLHSLPDSAAVKIPAKSNQK